MSKYAYLRPLVTPNFIFDFPSQFEIKKINEFISGNYNQTVKIANQNMQAIMSGSQLIWYIQSKNNNQIVGKLNLTFTNQELNTADIECFLSEELTDSQILEISQRVVHICTTNLELKDINIINSLNKITCQELKNHYNIGQ
ncbi:hypothetical protein RD055328_11920 [Companilactobacillus sp. RD055328]|uniref:hypothetical protein n=1 Tax=Companilactobacillus sp. RD055328 TaxID=2916634 RepID=UPI001FC8C41D|nr:hypothetical protein [Companilactobacillus sp. RD055328]GKQ43269.1 hypothetical protein RD055328_11920 [Companilactobacillus sp. RD055328]